MFVCDQGGLDHGKCGLGTILIVHGKIVISSGHLFDRYHRVVVSQCYHKIEL